MTIQRKSKRQKENAQQVAHELNSMQKRREKQSFADTKRMSKHSFKKHVELRNLARAYGLQKKKIRRSSIKDIGEKKNH